MLRTFHTCGEHYACVVKTDDAGSVHIPADEAGQNVLGDTRETIAEVQQTFIDAKVELERLKAVQRELEATTRRLIERSREARHRLIAESSEDRAAITRLLGEIAERYQEIKAECAAYAAEANEMVKQVGSHLATRITDARDRLEGFTNKADDIMVLLEEKADEVEKAHRSVLDRADEGLRRIATDRDFFERQLKDLLRSAEAVK